MSFYSLFKKAIRLSPKMALVKAWDIFCRSYQISVNRNQDTKHSTYIESPEWCDSIPFNYFSLPPKEVINDYSEIIIKCANKYQNHYFDLLGSGWIKIYHGLKCDGLEDYVYSNEERIFDRTNWLQYHLNTNNFLEASKISNLINNNYRFIDWQIDFKSGYRWDENQWYKDISYGKSLGADIKVPWELGRMQHLTTLALAAFLSNNSIPNSKPADVYINEFRSQILDFISSNPPNFGVQWKCTMDVAIRAANWLTAFDLFKNNHIEFDQEFMNCFINSIYTHGKYIIENLEWSSGMRCNHYIADICGLLFIAAYLPVSEETNTWLAFCLQEITSELDYQFYNDGGNFEASTNYHCFSLQMLLFAINIIIGLPEEKINGLIIYNKKKSINIGSKILFSHDRQEYQIIPDSKKIVFSNKFNHKLRKIVDFTISIINQKGEIPQIGDNDSGFFIRFTPNYTEESFNLIKQKYLNLKKYNSSEEENTYLIDNYNNHHDLISIIAALFNDSELLEYYKPSLIDFNIIKLSILKNNPDFYNYLDKIKDVDFIKEDFVDVSSKKYEDFGLYIYRSHYYNFTFRCGQIGQNGKGGHSHNDQLSISFSAANKQFIVDSGTYLYTPLPALRNKYRSTKLHNTLCIDDLEQNYWASNDVDDLFWIQKDKSKSNVTSIGNNHILAEHKGFADVHKRKLEFYLYSVVASDECRFRGLKTVYFHLHPDIEVDFNYQQPKIIFLRNDLTIIELSSETNDFIIEDYNFSPGYGVIITSKRLILHSKENIIKWKLEIVASGK